MPRHQDKPSTSRTRSGSPDPGAELAAWITRFVARTNRLYDTAPAGEIVNRHLSLAARHEWHYAGDALTRFQSALTYEIGECRSAEATWRARAGREDASRNEVVAELAAADRLEAAVAELVVVRRRLVAAIGRKRRAALAPRTTRASAGERRTPARSARSRTSETR